MLNQQSNGSDSNNHNNGCLLSTKRPPNKLHERYARKIDWEKIHDRPELSDAPFAAATAQRQQHPLDEYPVLPESFQTRLPNQSCCATNCVIDKIVCFCSPSHPSFRISPLGREWRTTLPPEEERQPGTLSTLCEFQGRWATQLGTKRNVAGRLADKRG